MIFEHKVQPITFTNGALRFEFLPSGETFQFLGGNVLINQMLGNTLDGSPSNIYLRRYLGDTLEVAPLLGKNSNVTFQVTENKALWSGTVFDLDYCITFALASDSTWFWSIDLKGSDQLVDVIFTQDISVSDKGATVTNELYMSQYLDNKVFAGDYGYVVCSRQNQGNVHPYLQLGALNSKVIGYSTDAMQFFGQEFKKTHIPTALTGDLPNVNYQFEQSFIALQTEKKLVENHTNFTFYGLFQANHAMAVQELEFQSQILSDYATFNSLPHTPQQEIVVPKIKATFGAPFVSDVLSADEISHYYPQQNLIEEVDGKLLSFFTPDHSHVVLQEKELLVERPHGHIITTAVNEQQIQTDLITSTSYMYGIFNAQVVCGNTSMNKLLSVPRGLLNVLKNSGQRIYVKLDGVYRLLTLPAAYEVGVNHAKWFYKIGDDLLSITNFAVADCSDIVLHVASEQGIKYEFIVTNQLVMGSNEFDQAADVTVFDNGITVKPLADSFLANTYADIHYNMLLNGSTWTISDDAIFYTDETSRFGTLLTMALDETADFTLTIQGRLVAEDIPSTNLHDFEAEKAKFASLYQSLTQNFHLSLPGESRKDIAKINEIFWWYTHNAMVHYAVPHGLEQPGGAAWGTRDVCQGPMEYFLMAQHYELAREILLEIYAHQFLETGEWPQWFMFDKYNMQQDESHGDVVFWPLKSLGDYIKATGDTDILTTPVVYRHFPHNEISEPETILTHVARAIKSIENRFLYDTALISYDGGDWDDTLQPANKELKEKLVSSWTVALAYQSIKQLGEQIGAIDSEFSTKLVTMSEKINTSFNELLVKDEVIAGFAYCPNDQEIEFMLHPDDQKTGINYRLLPMTRSIIAQLVSKEQANQNISLIEQHLTFPDGVRLMNRPATYNGGDIKFFQRAEQAANVGREIGLNYIHAHIRFIEAMAKYGDSNKAWSGLETINPINIHDKVENAMLRQSNAYFSSSEGAFTSRYDFQENFDKLRTGDIPVKGGWRIYSSGPGIYLNQLVSNVLGFRLTADKVILDPVLPSDVSGLQFNYMFEAHPITVEYIFTTDNEAPISKIEVNGTCIDFSLEANPYRSGGAVIDKTLLKSLMQTKNTIIITR
ncbi:MAG: GH36-type glycosyl hydrolase domain-containing protein [Culicoidibacterales bacterium]